MNCKNIVASLLVLILLIGFSCAPKTIPSPQATGSSATKGETIQPASAQGNWEVEWENTLKAARKEGNIVVYAASSGPALSKAVPIIKEKYGLNLDVSAGRGDEVYSRLLAQRKAGLYLVDVQNMGANNNMVAKQAGVLDKLEPAFILPEVKEPKAWFGSKLRWGDKDNLIYMFYAFSPPVIGINTELVKLNEIKSYYDLLAPKWKGKITINDPTKFGIGFNSFSSLILAKGIELDFFRQLASQQPVILEDQRLQIDWLAKAKYSIALWPRPAPLNEYKDAGAPVDFSPAPKEGVHLSVGGGALSLIKNAPHPNAAKVFINWILSREGQIHLQKFEGVQSARIDIPVEGVPRDLVRQPGVNYFLSANTIEEWIINDQDRYIEMAKQIFVPLMK